MSYNQYLQGKVIQTGCEWRLKIKIQSTALEPFPEGAKFTAQVRADAESAVLATLTSENGHIVRVDSSSLEIFMPGAMSATWSSGFVMLDIIRTDLPENIHLGFDLTIPVKRSITRL